MRSRTTQLLCILLGTLAALQGQAQPSREPAREDTPPVARERSEAVPRNGLQDLPAREDAVRDNAVREESTAISRREASELAREAFEGRVLSVRLDRGQWRIRMDEEGTVFNVLVDAESGKVSRPSE